MSDVRNKAIKYRIYPDDEQKELFAKIFGCVRKIWNLMLSDKKDSYVKNKTFVNVTPAMYKDDYPFLKEVDSLALANTQLNLQKAIRDVKNGKGFPRFKSKRKSKRAYTTNNVNGNIEVGDKYIKLPKVGYIKIKIHRDTPDSWTLKSVTISQSGSGKYYVSVLYEYEEEVLPVKVKEDNVIGMDYKSKGLYVDSNGYSPGSPRYTKKYADKLAREQRHLSKKKGFRRGEPVSNNFIKQLKKVNKIHEKIANSRKDFLHKESTRIANLYDAVCVEDINMQEIAHTHEYHNYRKATYDNGFGMFRDFLAYKLEDRGKKLIKVDKAFPSSKLCSSCGDVFEELDGSIRKWECPCCGTLHDRDLNAAINIRSEGLRMIESVG